MKEVESVLDLGSTVNSNGLTVEDNCLDNCSERDDFCSYNLNFMYAECVPECFEDFHCSNECNIGCDFTTGLCLWKENCNPFTVARRKIKHTKKEKAKKHYLSNECRSKKHCPNQGPCLKDKSCENYGSCVDCKYDR
jgi:hypothetical protein